MDIEPSWGNWSEVPAGKAKAWGNIETDLEDIGWGLVWMHIAEGRENEQDNEVSRSLNLGEFVD